VNLTALRSTHFAARFLGSLARFPNRNLITLELGSPLSSRLFAAPEVRSSLYRNPITRKEMKCLLLYDAADIFSPRLSSPFSDFLELLDAMLR
jgi:hypothetical protein